MKLIEEKKRKLRDGSREFLVIITLGHDTEKIRVLGLIDDATVMELFFLAIIVVTFAKFMRDGNIFGEKLVKTLIVLDSRENFKSFFRHVLI